MAVVVFLTSIAVGLINILIVILGFFKTPAGHVYLAVGHYFSDYFLYVQHIVQGIRGNWLIEYYYTPFDKTKTFMGWEIYILIGKLARLFNLSPFFAYWLAVFILTFFLALLIFFLIKKLLPKESFFFHFIVWLLALFATPFVKILTENGQLKFIPYDFWYAPMSFFHRFGGVPHHLANSILVVLIILLTSKLFDYFGSDKRWRFFSLIFLINLMIFFLLTIAPFQVINLVSAFVVTGWIYFNHFLSRGLKKNLIDLMFFLAVSAFILAGSILFIKLSLPPSENLKIAMNFDLTQFSYPRFWELLSTYGPILIFIPFGLKKYFRSLTPAKIIFFLFTVFSFFYLYTPLALFFGSHNRRFLTPVVYPLLSVLTVTGMETVSHYFFKKKTLFYFLVVVFFSYFVIVTYLIFQNFHVDRLSYVPKKMIDGIKFLEKFPDKKLVFNSPQNPIGYLIPIFVDKKVCLGQLFCNPSYKDQSTIADRFYQKQLSDKDAEQLVKENNIGYVILTRNESYSPLLLESYSFLKKIFDNEEIKIYKTIIN